MSLFISQPGQRYLNWNLSGAFCLNSAMFCILSEPRESLYCRFFFVLVCRSLGVMRAQEVPHSWGCNKPRRQRAVGNSCWQPSHPSCLHPMQGSLRVWLGDKEGGTLWRVVHVSPFISQAQHIRPKLLHCSRLGLNQPAVRAGGTGPGPQTPLPPQERTIRR